MNSSDYFLSYLSMEEGRQPLSTLQCSNNLMQSKEEAQRYEQNLIARIDGIYEAARQNHLIKIDYLKWVWLYIRSKCHLMEILKKNPPRYNPEAGDNDLVVVYFADRSDVNLFSPRSLADDRVDEEGIVGSDNSRDYEVDDDEESDVCDDDRDHSDSQTNMADSIASTLASVMLEQSI